ncbi:hypothetical protein A0H76_233 [Hepatospora eriocheir]|uniref:Uncharacterized protein n=1 Tax=Hepatospora eriocheir TaxID=1081669 RepID=A0A1X0QJ08_9MICR|nr:hypothetical protein A0H76_233 [Hepatospora eriocheir]
MLSIFLNLIRCKFRYHVTLDEHPVIIVNHEYTNHVLSIGRPDLVKPNGREFKLSEFDLLNINNQSFIIHRGTKHNAVFKNIDKKYRTMVENKTIVMTTDKTDKSKLSIRKVSDNPKNKSFEILHYNECLTARKSKMGTLFIQFTPCNNLKSQRWEAVLKSKITSKYLKIEPKIKISKSEAAIEHVLEELTKYTNSIYYTYNKKK